MAKVSIVAMGGDGIGPELVDATCYILEQAGFHLNIIKPLHGEAAFGRDHSVFPEETKKLCEETGVVLFGMTKGTCNPIVSYLRYICDNYVDVRPIKYYPGATSCLKDPVGIDFVILRENSEGLYPPREGDISLLAKGLPGFRDKQTGKPFSDYGEGKFAVRIISERGVRRLAAFACVHALKRKSAGHPGKITCATKSNMFKESCGLFTGIVEEEVKKHSDLTYEHEYIDNLASRILRAPRELDVIVTSNLFGDIVSDEAAELVGGFAMVGDGFLGGRVVYFASIPIYSSPEKEKINPTGTLLAAKMMLGYLDMNREAEALERAIAGVYADRVHLTWDQGGNATTREFADAVLRKISSDRDQEKR